VHGHDHGVDHVNVNVIDHRRAERLQATVLAATICAMTRLGYRLYLVATCSPCSAARHDDAGRKTHRKPIGTPCRWHVCLSLIR
jgi:hypothetical protein